MTRAEPGEDSGWKEPILPAADGSPTEEAPVKKLRCVLIGHKWTRRRIGGETTLEVPALRPDRRRQRRGLRLGDRARRRLSVSSPLPNSPT